MCQCSPTTTLNVAKFYRQLIEQLAASSLTVEITACFLARICVPVQVDYWHHSTLEFHFRTHVSRIRQVVARSSTISLSLVHNPPHCSSQCSPPTRSDCGPSDLLERLWLSDPNCPSSCEGSFRCSHARGDAEGVLTTEASSPTSCQSLSLPPNSEACACACGGQYVQFAQTGLHV